MRNRQKKSRILLKKATKSIDFRRNTGYNKGNILHGGRLYTSELHTIRNFGSGRKSNGISRVAVNTASTCCAWENSHGRSWRPARGNLILIGWRMSSTACGRREFRFCSVRRPPRRRGGCLQNTPRSPAWGRMESARPSPPATMSAEPLP